MKLLVNFMWVHFILSGRETQILQEKVIPHGKFHKKALLQISASPK